MNRPSPARPVRRVFRAAAALALAALAAGCASSAGGDGFARDTSGGGSDSVVFAEQPWVDLQVENEIAVQLLDKLGYKASVKKNLSVENAASALRTGAGSVTASRPVRTSSETTSVCSVS